MGGTLNITLGSEAGAVGCRDIILVQSNVVQEEENFLCVLRFFLEGVGAGQPSATLVVIQGIKINSSSPRAKVKLGLNTVI